jgi:4-aminobutyrate--pyruvate transaminase
MKQKDALVDLDHKYSLHPFTNFHDHEKQGPRIIVEAYDNRIKDIDGKEYIDAFSGSWNVAIGHGRREVADAIKAQMDKLEYFSPFFRFTNPPAIELAEKVVSLMPDDWNMGHVLFTCGGSETNDSIFKICRMYWELKGKSQKKKIISRRFGYHGVTMGSLSATGIDHFKLYFEPPASSDFTHIMAPYCYQCEAGLEASDCDLECAGQLEETILREGPDTVAAFIGEPVIGAGGVIPPHEGYWPKVRQICDNYDVLLIADEVITGFGRTGKMFGSMHWNLRPDMVAVAKSITSGYFPLGGAVINNDIFGTLKNDLPDFVPFLHGYTYNNHPVGCAAGLANLRYIEEHNLVENAARMGDYLGERLQRLYARPSVGDVRCMGLMAAVEIVKDRETKAPIGDIPMDSTHRIEELTYEQGVFARAGLENMELAPPLTITKEEIDKIVDALDSAIAQMESEML